MSIPHYRRNFTALVGDYVGFSVGMAFVSSTTVLPNLAGHLTDSEVAIGMISTVSYGAWLLPQLLFANLLMNKRRKKPYLMLGGGIGRPVYMVYGVALGLGLHQYPTLALLALFGAQILMFCNDSLAAMAWFDISGKAIPGARRGRLFGMGQLIGGILSIGAGAIIAILLGSAGPPFPNNYAVILALGSVFLLIGLTFLGFVAEPDEPVDEKRTAWRDYLPQLREMVRHDPALGRLILVRLLAGFNALALGFYILFATRELGLSPATVGLFAAAETVGRILASVSLGTLVERAGSHRVVQVATGVSMTAPLLGLVLFVMGAKAGTATAVIYAWVFVTLGVNMNASVLGYFNYALELAPAGRRPIYMGMLNASGGFLMVLPTLGGWILRATSYGVLFALTAAVLIMAHLLSFSLPSPRETSTQLKPEPVG